MQVDDPNSCRRAAAECLELARLTDSVETKRTLLTMAQEWIRLAYYRQIANFDRAVDEFNEHQLRPGRSSEDHNRNTG
jgi:hypothetical protein